MWTRAELKKQGKAAFKNNYWRCVLVAVILTACIGGVSAATGRSAYQNYADETPTGAQAEQESTGEDIDQLLEELEGEDAEIPSLKEALKDSGIELEATKPAQSSSASAKGGILAAIASISLGLSAVSFLVKMLLLNPVEVGCQSFFLKNLHEPASEKEIKNGFSQWGRNIGAMLLSGIYLFLWSLLFIIPGLVKSYSYRMVPFILADDPACGAKEAITRSREMMNGHKWSAFVLDLSFIGWYLLSILTLGLLLIFWVNPYQYSTNAALYERLKAEG